MKMDTPLIQETPKSWTKSVILTVILVFAMCTLAGKHMMGSREQALGEPESHMSQPEDPCSRFTLRMECLAAVENLKSLRCVWRSSAPGARQYCTSQGREKINRAPASACLPEDDPNGAIFTRLISGQFLCAFATGTSFRAIKERCYHVYMEQFFIPQGLTIDPGYHIESQLSDSTPPGGMITSDPVGPGDYLMIFRQVEDPAPAAPAPAAPAPAAPAPAAPGRRPRIPTCDTWCAAQGLRVPFHMKGKRCEQIQTRFNEGGVTGCNQRACGCQ